MPKCGRRADLPAASAQQGATVKAVSAEGAIDAAEPLKKPKETSSPQATEAKCRDALRDSTNLLNDTLRDNGATEATRLRRSVRLSKGGSEKPAKRQTRSHSQGREGKMQKVPIEPQCLEANNRIRSTSVSPKEKSPSYHCPAPKRLKQIHKVKEDDGDHRLAGDNVDQPEGVLIAGAASIPRKRALFRSLPKGGAGGAAAAKVSKKAPPSCGAPSESFLGSFATSVRNSSDLEASVPILRSSRSHPAAKREKSRAALEAVVASRDCYDLVHPKFDSSTFMPGVSKYDVGSVGDQLAVPEYVTDIFHRLYDRESRTPRPNSRLTDSSKITPSMRATLFDWLVEIHRCFRLRTETLHLAFDIVDRYISIISVPRRRFQLLGATALVIASKYEEIEPPELQAVAHMTDGMCNRQDILDMETAVLCALDYRISNPTSYPFLRRFLFLIRAPRTTRCVAYYYLERSAQDYTLVSLRPSLVAAAVVSLAINHPDVRERDKLDRTPPGVPPVLLEYTKFSWDSVAELANRLAKWIGSASPSRFGFTEKKFESCRYDSVSKLQPPVPFQLLPPE